jgi:plasmid stabilization system protein ParE
MKYRIKFLSEAADDREIIIAYLSQYYKSTVKKFLQLLKKRISQLKQFPYSCPIYEDDPDYRRLVVGEYLVFYIINENDKMIEIHRIFHGSRNVEKQLGKAENSKDDV